MAICDLTGKGKQYGNNVPFSQKKTRRNWKPNIQNRTVIVNGQKLRLKLSASAIRTLRKKGAGLAGGPRSSASSS